MRGISEDGFQRLAKNLSKKSSTDEVRIYTGVLKKRRDILAIELDVEGVVYEGWTMIQEGTKFSIFTGEDYIKNMPYRLRNYVGNWGWVDYLIDEKAKQSLVDSSDAT